MLGKAVKYHQNMSESKSKNFYEKYGDQLMEFLFEIIQEKPSKSRKTRQKSLEVTSNTMKITWNFLKNLPKTIENHSNQLKFISKIFGMNVRNRHLEINNHLQSY